MSKLRLDVDFWIPETSKIVNTWGYVALYENLDKLNRFRSSSKIRNGWNEVRFMLHFLAQVDREHFRPIKNCYYKLLKLKEDKANPVLYRKEKKMGKELGDRMIKEDEIFYCSSMAVCIMDMCNYYRKAKKTYDMASSIQDAV